MAILKNKHQATYQPIGLETIAKSGEIRTASHEHAPRSPAIGWWFRISPILAVLLSTSAAMAIFGLRLSRWKDSLGFYSVVTTQRVAVQVAIHILATTFSALWIYAVCASFNNWSRARFANGSVSLNNLRLWTAMSQGRTDYRLSTLNLTISAIFSATGLLGAWLWTGALTPQLTSFTTVGYAVVPKTGSGAYPMLKYRLDADTFNFDCFITNQANGSFTPCPGLYQSGSLLDAAGSATTINGSPRNHSKNDNSGYRYIGRSYGMGSSVGLTTEIPTSSSTVQGYSFNETGYLTSVQCIYNSSSKWIITPSLDNACTGDTGLPCLFKAEGCFPNSGWTYPSNANMPLCGPDGFAQASLSADGDSIAAMGSHNSDNVTEYFVAIAAGSNYAQLDQVQCQFMFEPKTFAVNVSIIDTTIQVAPSPLEHTADIDPRGLLQSKVMDALNTISMIQTSLYVSTPGSALQNNIRNYMSRMSPDRADPDSATPADVLVAVEDSMQAMADDILESIAAAALTWPNATSSQQVQFTGLGYEIGELPYIIGVVIYQLIALLGILILTFFSGFWGQTPAFDYSDVGSLAVAAHLGAQSADSAAKADFQRWEGGAGFPPLQSLTAEYRHVGGEAPTVTIHNGRH